MRCKDRIEIVSDEGYEGSVFTCDLDEGHALPHMKPSIEVTNNKVVSLLWMNKEKKSV